MNYKNIFIQFSTQCVVYFIILSLLYLIIYSFYDLFISTSLGIIHFIDYINNKQLEQNNQNIKLLK